jgi:hypothetical protein
MSAEAAIPFRRRPGAPPPPPPPGGAAGEAGAGAGAGAGVDWGAAERALAAVDPALSDPRFDPLRHVLATLGAPDAAARLAELRAQRARVGAAVDAVVEASYPGFARSLQNYSAILAEFGDARRELDALRRALGAARAALARRPARLAELAARDLELGDAARLLADVAAAAEVPARAARLAAAGDYALAAAALLDGAARAARGELAGVGALREVRSAMARRRRELLAALVDELEARAYGGGAGAGAPRTPERPARGGAPPGAPRSALPARRASGRAALSAGAPAHRRSVTYGGGGLAALAAEGHLVEPGPGLPALVDCAAALGGAPGALRAVRARLPGRFRAALAAALIAFPRVQWAPPDDAGPAETAAAEQAAAEALLESAFDAALGTLQAAARLLQLLALARSPRPTAGLEMLIAEGGGDEAAGGVAADAPLGAAAAAAECEGAWEALQVECRAVLAALLGAPPPPRGGGASAAAPSAGRAAAGGAGGGAPPALPTELAFSLEAEAGEPLLPEAAAAPAAGAGRAPAAAPAPADLRLLVARALGGRDAGAALAVAAYGPALRLDAAAARLLDGLADAPAPGGGGGGTPGARGASALLAAPWRSFAAPTPGAPPHAEAAPGGAPARAALRDYVDAFLRMEYLPSVFVDARARCGAALAAPGALAPRLGLRGAHAPAASLLPAAAATAALAEELLGAAARAPPFATHIAGVLENALGRVLEAFHSAAAAAAKKSASFALAAAAPVAQAMAREPAAALLGSPVSFFVGRDGSALETFLSSALAAGAGAAGGAGAGAAERELAARLLAARPAPADLVAAAPDAAARLAALASLAESADYVADAVARAALAAGAAMAEGEAPVSPTRGGPAGDGWQSQLTDRLRRSLRLGARAAPGPAAALSHIADRFRALGGQCARALRLEALLAAAHHLGALPALAAAGGAGAAEAGARVAALAPALGRFDDDLEAYLSPDRRAYVFAELPAAVGRLAAALLPECGGADAAGGARAAAALGALAPALCAAGGGAGGADGARQLDRARQLYAGLGAAPAAAGARPNDSTTYVY